MGTNTKKTTMELFYVIPNSYKHSFEIKFLLEFVDSHVKILFIPQIFLFFKFP